MMTYADFDPLVKPHDMARIEEHVRLRVTGLSDDTQFTAYRVPPEAMDGPGEAHLFVASPHPDKSLLEYTDKSPVIIDQARLLLSTWDSYLRSREHYVGTKEDKLMKAFILLASRHSEKLEQLRNTIN